MPHDTILTFDGESVAVDCFAFLTGEHGPNGALGLVTVQALIADLRPYGSTFRVQRYRDAQRIPTHVEIYGGDPDCVNYNYCLATCWLQPNDDGSSSFYWES